MELLPSGPVVNPYKQKSRSQCLQPSSSNALWHCAAPSRVRAFVVGDASQRLVARALEKNLADAFQNACLPHQFRLSTRAGTEGRYRGPLPRAVTEGRYKLFPRTTVVSVDAIGSYDHVSRQAMLEGLRSKPALEPLLPFARQFYDCSSVYTWLDVDGGEHHIAQGGEEEQGDP